MKRLMAVGLTFLFLLVVAGPSVFAQQQSGKQDIQSQQQSTWVCPHTGKPCTMAGQGRMHRGGHGIQGQQRGMGRCPNCPYYSQSQGQGASQSPAPAKADTSPVKQ